MRDLMDHIREVPKGATDTIRTVCKETLQSLVTTSTNMEFKSRVKRFARTVEAIANFVGKEYVKKLNYW
jgi:ADP-dependent phosphofructokinase/glucokinase